MKLNTSTVVPVAGTNTTTLSGTAGNGTAATFLRSDAVIDAFDATNPADIAAAAATGSIDFAARRDHVHTIGTGIVTRTMQAASGKGWQFIGQATASTAIRTGTITGLSSFKQLHFEFYISGYSNTAIGRLIVGPAAGLSETATNHCTELIEGVTRTTTSVSVPGWPTAVTVNNVERWGWMQVKNVAAARKTMKGEGLWGGTAATVVPTGMLYRGLMSDTTNAIDRAEMAVYDAITGAAISARTFTTAYLNAWGRTDD